MQLVSRWKVLERERANEVFSRSPPFRSSLHPYVRARSRKRAQQVRLAFSFFVVHSPVPGMLHVPLYFLFKYHASSSNLIEHVRRNWTRKVGWKRGREDDANEFLREPTVSCAVTLGIGNCEKKRFSYCTPHTSYIMKLHTEENFSIVSFVSKQSIYASFVLLCSL